MAEVGACGVWGPERPGGFLSRGGKIPQINVLTDHMALRRPTIRAAGVTDMGPKIAKGATLTGRKGIEAVPLPIASERYPVDSPCRTGSPTPQPWPQP